MGNLVKSLMTLLLLYAREGPLAFALPCSPTNSTLSDDNHPESSKNCIEPVTPPKGEEKDNADEPKDTVSFASPALYTTMVVIGVILLPVIVFARVCWLAKLQRQRNNAVNEVRRMVDQRLQQQQSERGVFSIDLANVPFENIYGKPPSYEECLANPGLGSPPPYDQNSFCNEKQFGENNHDDDQNEANVTAPSTSSIG